MKRTSIALLAVAVCMGQAPEPKASAAEYPAHQKIGNIEVGAESWGHGFVAKQGAYALDQHIAVEVAVFPEKGKPIDVRAGHFQLRLNGKISLVPQATGLVAMTLKHPDMLDNPRLEASAGAGDGEVVVGRPRRTERFPGDNRMPRNPLPPPPQPGDNANAPPKEPPMKIEDVVAGAALDEGEARAARSGFLFFAYKGKMKSLKSIELLYEGPAGSASLTLR